MIQLRDYLQFADASYTAHLNRGRSAWRKGQAYSNLLHMIRPDLAAQAQDAQLDPFYRDEILDEFVVWLSYRW